MVPYTILNPMKNKSVHQNIQITKYGTTSEYKSNINPCK